MSVEDYFVKLLLNNGCDYLQSGNPSFEGYGVKANVENGQLELTSVGGQYGSPDRVVQTVIHAFYQFFHQTVYNMSFAKGDMVVSLFPMSELEQRFAEVVLDKNTICPVKMDPPYRPVP